MAPAESQSAVPYIGRVPLLDTALVGTFVDREGSDPTCICVLCSAWSWFVLNRCATFRFGNQTNEGSGSQLVNTRRKALNSV